MKYKVTIIVISLFCLLCTMSISCLQQTDMNSKFILQQSANSGNLSGDEHDLQGNKSVEKALSWLRSQQAKNGLIRSNSIPGDNVGWTYDQALTIIVFLTVGDVDSARHCTDAMLKIRDKRYNAWVDGYNVCTELPEAKAIAVGPNAWMGLAILQLYRVTKEQVYLEAAKEIGDFIISLQSKDGKTSGSVPGGYDQNGGLFPWTSTEHNADSIVFLTALAKFTGMQSYHDSAIKICKWMDSEMWDKQRGYYCPGYKDNTSAAKSDFGELLDSQTWTILAIFGAAEWSERPEEIKQFLHNGLPFIDAYQCTIERDHTTLIGFPKITDFNNVTPSFWSEGTAGYLLAARRILHKNPNMETMLRSLRDIQEADGSIPYSVGTSYSDVPKQFQSSDLVIADFESHPNRLFGSVEVYGDGEPDWTAITEAKFSEPYSWYYEPTNPDYNKANVHSGRQSFRVVNAGRMCKYKRQGWATLGLNLGSVIGCQEIRAVDVSEYKRLSFWARTDNSRGARLKVIFRDTYKRSYEPQAVPEPAEVGNRWTHHTIDLKNISSIVDLQNLTNIALSFGKNVGNDPDTEIYIDDIAFTGSDNNISVSNGSKMPVIFPQNWPFGSVAGTAWLIFVELDINSFGPFKEHITGLSPKSSDDENKDTCKIYSTPCSIFRDWLAFSANLDGSYRRTQFYKRDDDAGVFQGDSRLDLWLPPFRDEFSWGPYVRLSGVTSNKNYEWENNWGARPGIGFQIYPFSSRGLKEKSELYSSLAKLLGPLHLFAEQNKIHYSGQENSWRPDELVRAGLDYWKEYNVNDITKPWWGEIWNGLVWHSTNGFDKDYDTLIFANALRLGIRKPNDGLVSMFTPYFVAESSLSENGEYFWENRLLLGGGIRFAPPLKFLPPKLNITRLVVYAEYLNAACYYRSSASSSVPNDDFRIGINIYIGEWWPR